MIIRMFYYSALHLLTSSNYPTPRGKCGCGSAVFVCAFIFSWSRFFFRTTFQKQPVWIVKYSPGSKKQFPTQIPQLLQDLGIIFIVCNITEQHALKTAPICREPWQTTLTSLSDFRVVLPSITASSGFTTERFPRLPVDRLAPALIGCVFYEIFEVL